MKPLLVLLLLASGCAAVQPKAGDACQAGEAVCQPGGAALMCVGGQYRRLSCPGVKGCATNKDRSVLCDQSSEVQPGMACPPDLEKHAQCSTADSYLTCASGVWTLGHCAMGACTRLGTQVVCQ